MRTPFNAAHFNCKYRKPEPMIVAMTEDLDWAPEREAIRVEELSGRPLILYRRFEQLLMDTFAAHDFTPDVVCRNDDARTTILWANAGLGVAIAPAAAVNLAAHNHLHVKRIDEPSLETRLAAIWPRSRYLSAVAKHFLQSF